VRDLSGKVAVVTGAAGGIGLGIAEAFVDHGMRVMLSDVDEPRLSREAERLERAGATVASAVADVADPGQVDALAARAVDRFGAVHVVCNNAGVIRTGRSWELSREDWDAVLAVNLYGVLNGIRAFVPLLLGSGQEGHVVNVASMAAVVPVPGIAPYSASKHAVLALSETLHDELVAAGAPIGVTVVMPGRVPTRLGRPVSAPDPDLGAVGPGELAPRRVGDLVVEAVRRNQLHLFTHPERVDEVRARFDRIAGSA
jgi:NAD(P)-dependent dehydrogenase (short-subunit alcohol dehydrogenase family)